jgi:hypothetical protein
MMNKAQLLNKENWLAYLERANEEELTRNAIANDIVAKIAEGLKKPETAKSITLEKADVFQEFFNFLSQEHDLTLTVEEMEEIVLESDKLITKMEQYLDSF